MRVQLFWLKTGKGIYGVNNTQITTSDLLASDINLEERLTRDEETIDKNADNIEILKQTLFYNRVLVKYGIADNFSNGVSSYSDEPIYYSYNSLGSLLLVDTSKINIDFTNCSIFLKDAKDHPTAYYGRRMYVLSPQAVPAYGNYVYYIVEPVPHNNNYAYDGLGSYFEDNSFYHLSYFRETIPPTEVNLAYASAPDKGTIESDTGDNAVIPIAGATNAGLMKAGFYDEGTFTPTLIDSGGGATYTVSSIDARYKRVGNLVFFSIFASITSTTGTPTGDLNFTNMPFASVTTPVGTTSTINRFSNSDGASAPTSAYVAATDLRFRLEAVGSQLELDFPAPSFTSGVVQVTGMYHTNTYTM